MPSDVLPGYGWNKDTGRYRDLNSGRFVGKNTINELLTTQIQSAESRLGALSTSFHEGKIAPSVWVEQMRTEVRRLAIQQRALGAGGFSQLDNRAFGSVGGTLRNTYGRIIGTAQDVMDGKASLPQLLNRVDGYIGEARQQYYKAMQDNPPIAQAESIIIYRRMLGDARHCSDCLRLYSAGWNTEFIAPGNQCSCNSHCRCSVIQKEILFNELDQWIGTTA